ncbi:N-acetylneuraminate lyase [Mycoplasma iguanae]|uniref:N-acetylneuraminate lyase n=1 Tax=Mycoplasma iguanae TaxID=292461 RepID=A0ABY5R8P0_9MOLU|nr:N-acetylneuraminate lyase [Mycoplasma iguanae]UVD81876.1 N-acetylneuraminate lyase [Mycoplasma iguanae]
MKKYQGLFSALITPFDENGKVKEQALRDIIKYLIEYQKIDGLYVTGSTGEFLLLSVEERKRIFEIVAQEAKEKITLIAQIGILNLNDVVEMGQYAQKLGFDAISAITPYYYSFSFEEVKSYYQYIAQRVDLPMFIYYLPQLAGGKMGIQQFGELLNIKNVLGCKFGATDVFLFERLISAYPEKIWMWAWDESLVTGLMLGATGFIGSTYNANAKGARRMIEAFDKHDIVTLRKEIKDYNDYIEALISTGLMQTLKAIMRLHGINAGFNKKPFKLIPEEELELVAKELIKKFNL